MCAHRLPLHDAGIHPRVHELALCAYYPSEIHARERHVGLCARLYDTDTWRHYNTPMTTFARQHERLAHEALPTGLAVFREKWGAGMSSYARVHTLII